MRKFSCLFWQSARRQLLLFAMDGRTIPVALWRGRHLRGIEGALATAAAVFTFSAGDEGSLLFVERARQGSRPLADLPADGALYSRRVGSSPCAWRLAGVFFLVHLMEPNESRAARVIGRSCAARSSPAVVIFSVASFSGRAHLRRAAGHPSCFARRTTSSRPARIDLGLRGLDAGVVVAVWLGRGVPLVAARFKRWLAAAAMVGRCDGSCGDQ
jgi:hypothetical protein